MCFAARTFCDYCGWHVICVNWCQWWVLGWCSGAVCLCLGHNWRCSFSGVFFLLVSTGYFCSPRGQCPGRSNTGKDFLCSLTKKRFRIVLYVEFEQCPPPDWSCNWCAPQPSPVLQSSETPAELALSLCQVMHTVKPPRLHGFALEHHTYRSLMIAWFPRLRTCHYSLTCRQCLLVTCTHCRYAIARRTCANTVSWLLALGRHDVTQATMNSASTVVTHVIQR